jgi:GntR family transcriptional repressor for pyruvate dehydrogenase complex
MSSTTRSDSSLLGVRTLNVPTDKRSTGVNPVRRKSLVTLILDQLRDFIASAGLRAGDRLPPERQLAEQLAVSRPSLRIALDWLSERGALRRVQGGGTYLEPNIASVLAQARDHDLVDQARFADVIEARACLETKLVELAAERAATDKVQALQTAVEQARQAKDALSWFQHELQFHLGLAQLAGNSILAGTLEALFPQILTTWQAHPARVDIERAAVDHLAILDAVVRRDGAAASRLMSEHLERFRNVLSG